MRGAILLFAAALFIGISSSSACDAMKASKCATELTTAASKGTQAVCNVLDEFKTCMSGAGCDGGIAAALKPYEEHCGGGSISPGSGCDAVKLASCSKELTTAASKGAQAVCPALDEFKKCMPDTGCTDAIAAALKPYEEHCGGGSISPGSGCDAVKLASCSKELTTAASKGAQAVCPFLDEFKKCMPDTGCTDAIAAAIKPYEEHCGGGGNVQPSIIAILATGLIMALRSYF